ncbi:MAG: hypothetical protein AABW87_01150 [Nanoarchaeota archaeon]
MEKIKARAIIEVLGSPESHVNEVMKALVDKIKTKKEITLVKEETFKAKKMEKQPLWSTFTEAEIDFKDVNALLGFCFDFMPSSIEIIEPEELKMNISDLTDFANDLTARLHQYDMILKNIHAENVLLKRKMEKKD